MNDQRPNVAMADALMGIFGLKRVEEQMIIGIDPGKTGAIAFIDSAGALVEDCPDTYQSAADLVIAREDQISHAFIELVHSMPKQGVASSFSFGKGFGAWLGILAGRRISYTLISPQEWKRHHGLIKADKDASRVRAAQLYPALAGDLRRAKDDGRAEALLIADYGKFKLRLETAK